MTQRAVVCDCCGATITVGLNLKLMRIEGFAKTGAVRLGHRDMCGKCWGRGCEFGKHLRRPA